MYDFQEALFSSDVIVYLAATGAGSTLQHLLWEPPGSSSYFAGANFPYESTETDDFLGSPPKKYTSMETAIDLAMASFVRASTANLLRQEERRKRRVLGIGVCASVATTREHRGGHVVHVAMISNFGCLVGSQSIPKSKGSWSRRSDDSLVINFVMIMLRKLLLVDETPNVFVQTPATSLLQDRVMRSPFFIGQKRKESSFLDRVGERYVYFPGTFNPLHDGHIAVADHIQQFEEPHRRREVVFVINTDQPHKAPLTPIDLLARIAMFRAHDRRSSRIHASPLLFTSGEPLFVDKIEKHPNRRWIVGADALGTMLDPKWGIPTGTVLEKIRTTGSVFYVFPCPWEGGTLSLIDVIQRYSLPPSSFLQSPSIGFNPVKIRSTELRQN